MLSKERKSFDGRFYIYGFKCRVMMNNNSFDFYLNEKL